MRLRLQSLLISALLVLLPTVEAENYLKSTSLNPCQASNNVSANLFDVLFTPSNSSLYINIVGVSTITGNVTIGLSVIAYGLSVYKTTVNPCDSFTFQGLCPMNEGPINLLSTTEIPASAVNGLPGITYNVPDLDAKVQIHFNSTDTGLSEACVEAELSNGKTVDHKGVAWVLAVISILALISAAITSGLGHSNTAAHVAANTLALFGYFQAQAFVGMTAVKLPPIVASWTQNFQWSMGIIRLDFLQSIATWYQRATGGTPSQVLSNLATTSVQVQKRSEETMYRIFKRAAVQMHNSMLAARSNAAGSIGTDTSNAIILRGIKRVGFRAGIETTNIFFTAYTFFVIFVIAVVLGVVIFKLTCEALIKASRMKADKFQDFRNGWRTVLKGILFRVALIGFPSMTVLCIWELKENDSGAEMVLAIFTIFTLTVVLAWASSKVIRLARRSIAMHKNPAYILYSDPKSLNKWGFLYVQFKATAYYFILVVLAYIVAKGLFIALGQDSGTLQAIALVVIESAFLITVCILRPYMDKKTNAFNIAICAVNFISAWFLLIFTGIFGQPGIVTGVMGVVFFIYNAAFSTILLLLVCVASIIAIVSKNPDTRYQPMQDDRGSFIKSQTQLTTELDALGATARGDGKHGWPDAKGARIEDDDDSWSGHSSDRAQQQQHQNSAYQGAGHRGYTDAPLRAPAPGYQSDIASGRHVPPSYPRGDDKSRTGSMTSWSRGGMRQQPSPSPSPSPWQRGAGYD